jgi:hypothetical protein
MKIYRKSLCLQLWLLTIYCYKASDFRHNMSHLSGRKAFSW